MPQHSSRTVVYLSCYTWARAHMCTITSLCWAYPPIRWLPCFMSYIPTHVLCISPILTRTDTLVESVYWKASISYNKYVSTVISLMYIFSLSMVIYSLMRPLCHFFFLFSLGKLQQGLLQVCVCTGAANNTLENLPFATCSPSPITVPLSQPF